MGFTRGPLWERLWAQIWPSSAKDAAAAESLAAARAQPEAVKQVLMQVENGSLLAISLLPTFRYNPQWSSASRASVGRVVEVQGQRLRVVFDAGQHRTPPLCFWTTFLQVLWPLPVPMVPPGVSIEIQAQDMEGWVDLETGAIQLQFDSEWGGLGPWGNATSSDKLKVRSPLTTEALRGRVFSAVGSRLRDQDSRAELVAISNVPETADPVQNRLLLLPTDALSVLRVQLQFVMEQGSGAGQEQQQGQQQEQPAQ